MLICIGEILVDIFKEDNKETILPGGAPFNVACNSLLYTCDVSFYGVVGKDNNGELLINNAKEKPFKELHIKQLDNRHTTEAIVELKDGERSFRFNRALGADYMLDISDIDLSSIHDNDIVHIGSLMLSEVNGVEFFHQLINKIREKSKAKISFDINYREDIFSSSGEAKKVFLGALKEADILKFSLEEITLLSNEQDIILGLKKLLNDKQVAVVTLGSKGSLYYHNGHYLKVDSIPVKPIDTTGAGDAFYSYFLASLVNHPDFVNDDEQIKYYLRRANVVGAMATLKKGAINSAPQESEIDLFLNNHQ